MLPTSYLFVPGDRPERFSKAAKTGAGMVVLDLEDAVAVGSKDAARLQVAGALAAGDFRACIRINGIDTEWFEKDLRLLALDGVAAVMLPKAESAEALAKVRAAAGWRMPLIPIVETARGLAAAGELAGCPDVLRIAFGSVDFQHDLGIEGDDLELLFARSQIVLVSRLAGVGAPVDGVTLAVKDTERARMDALRARRMGFGAKLCIHPTQIAPVNEAFAPDGQTIAWARGVLAAASSTSAGALTHEGRLIDKPVVDRARAVLGRVAS